MGLQRRQPPRPERRLWPSATSALETDSAAVAAARLVQRFPSRRCWRYRESLRVPHPSGIVAAVKANNVPVEYLVFEDEGHGFVKRENEKRGYEAVLKFLDTHLKP
ncbi:MAG: prolyl oligopeptidase family serine peptidase [Rhodanobacteraceae bacterium]|nr:prolyl oligopeptidase family serine peptidase [Rhodanobacteraceae bacterium]